MAGPVVRSRTETTGDENEFGLIGGGADGIFDGGLIVGDGDVLGADDAEGGELLSEPGSGGS